MTEPFVCWFDEIGKGDVAIAGGKGANLGELTRAGIAVPPGFIVNARAYQEFLAGSGLSARIDAYVAAVDVHNVQSLQMIAQEIKSAIAATPVPEAVAMAVAGAYGRLGGGPVAVRSSATAEDLPEASFAGQQSTFLNVTGVDRLIGEVRACWASLYEAHAVSYRVQAGFRRDVAIAVVVQQMVQSERSGIMFTTNPVTKDTGQIVIEAVFGLGEAAVSGVVTPDMYIVDKQSLAVIDRMISEQERELVRDPDAKGPEGNVWQEVPSPRRSLVKLSDEEATALGRLGLLIEALYGAPQDIEWAIEQGQVYVLQARPITTLTG